MGIKKTAAIEQVLGEKRIHDDSVDELMPRYILANQEMLKEIGGETAWNALDEAAQKELNQRCFKSSQLTWKKKFLKNYQTRRKQFSNYLYE